MVHCSKSFKCLIPNSCIDLVSTTLGFVLIAMSVFSRSNVFWQHYLVRSIIYSIHISESHRCNASFLFEQFAEILWVFKYGLVRFPGFFF